MKEAGAGAVAQDGEATRAGWKDWQALLLLVLITLTVRVLLLCRTEVAARDSIGYIRYALQFEKPDLTWSDVLRSNHQHPGYPLAVLAVSYPVRYFLGTTPDSMQLSAQLASGVAALLLVIPMYYLGKMFRGRFVGFWAALLFQLLPVVSHILSDGISEAVFLLWCACAMYFGWRGLQNSKAADFALCGLFSGLGYVTRPEGALVLLATGLVLAASQLLPDRRLAWRRWLACASALTIPAFVAGSFYFVPTGNFTNKPSVKEVLASPTAQAHPQDVGGCVPVFASIWASSIKNPTGNIWRDAGSAVWALGVEIVVCFHYLWVLPALLGIWWNRDLLRRLPGTWMLTVLCVLYTLVLVRLALKVGYISNRHVLVLVMCGTYTAVAALSDWPQIVPLWLVRGKSPAFALASLLVVVGTCLPKTLTPLHANRAGHRAAGLWLAQQLQPGDEVVDDHHWSHYFSGQVFREGQPVPQTSHAQRYTVISRAKDADVAQKRQNQEQEIINAGGTVVYHWPLQRPVENAKVVIYESPRR